MSEALLYADGYFPFCIPTEIAGLPFTEWDETTYYENTSVVEVDDETGEYTITVVTKGYSNSTTVLQPVVGDGTPWVKMSIEAFSELYWRVRRLTLDAPLTAEMQWKPYSSDSVTADLTASPIDNDGTPRVFGQSDYRDDHGHLVCGYKNQWADTPDMTVTGTLSYPVDVPVIDVTGTGTADMSAEPEQGTNSATLSATIFASNNLASWARAVATEPGFVYVRLASILTVHIRSWNELFEHVIHLGRESWGSYENIEFFSGRSDQTTTATITLLGIDYEVPVSREVIGLDQSVTLAECELPTGNFTEPIKIIADQYWTYGGIYDEDTGEPVP